MYTNSLQTSLPLVYLSEDFHRTVYPEKNLFFPQVNTEWNAFPANVAMVGPLDSFQFR